MEKDQLGPDLQIVESPPNLSDAAGFGLIRKSVTPHKYFSPCQKKCSYDRTLKLVQEQEEHERDSEVKDSVMAAFFPKIVDKYVQIGGILSTVGAVIGIAVFAYATAPSVLKTGYQPVQPVPYSHKLHAGNMGMDCYYCHYTVYKAAYAAIPPTQVCMNCHAKVKTDSPLLEKVRESYATGQPVQWVRVHKLADYVYFNHSAHINSGVSCVSCH
ncbi:MAG: cytochrome c3 family protein, partial [Bryobacteraceae bacterium]